MLIENIMVARICSFKYEYVNVISERQGEIFLTLFLHDILYRLYFAAFWYQELERSRWFKNFKGHKLVFSLICPTFVAEFAFLSFSRDVYKMLLNLSRYKYMDLGDFQTFAPSILWVIPWSDCTSLLCTSCFVRQSAEWPRWGLATEISSHLSLLSSSPPPSLLLLFTSAHKISRSISLSLSPQHYVFHFSLFLFPSPSCFSCQIFHLSSSLILYLSFYEAL